MKEYGMGDEDTIREIISEVDTEKSELSDEDSTTCFLILQINFKNMNLKYDSLNLSSISSDC